MPDALRILTAMIHGGRAADDTQIKPAVESCLSERYHKATLKDVQIRNAYALSRDESEGGVPWAGLINPENPTSGPYGGTSLVWFPGQGTSLIGFGVGTRGIAPDEGILTRPGHRRRISALRRYLSRLGVLAWSKSDPAALGIEVPQVVREWWPEFSSTFQRYGREMYCFARLPAESEAAAATVRAFFDLYAYERGWKALAGVQAEYERLIADLRSELFQVPTARDVAELVEARRFVILQGPPGTGKTRLSDVVKRDHFRGRGQTIQFHPSVTYEDFIIGLTPDPQSGQLRFQVRPGALLTAASQARDERFLLVIDEINRADLGKVLGEAIYLFEADEVGGANPRVVSLPHPFEGRNSFRIPENLYVLATMNTADRSIAPLDLAIRRRFAFMTIPPDRTAITLPAAREVFDQVTDVFVEHASDEALGLMPGHAYYLAKDDMYFAKRVSTELIPLLDDYLRQGLLGAAAPELQAVRDSLVDKIHG